MNRTFAGNSNAYIGADLFTFTGAGTRGGSFGGGCSSTTNSFSIDDGTTLLKQENDYCKNGLDVADWATGPNDSFSQFATLGESEPVTALDLRVMDALGYDRVTAVAPVTATPEPSTLALMVSGLAGVGASGWKRRQRRRA